MGMSTSVRGFVPPDEQWKRMKAIWDSCKAANVPVPKEVDEFFDGMPPDPTGVEVSIPKREWHNDHAQGYEVDIDSIPKHVKVIRFYNSW